MDMLLEQFKTIFDRPEKVKKLRNLILQLAVRGKLVEQDENDEPASVLLEKIKEEKENLIKEGKMKKEKLLPEINEDEKPYELPSGWEWARLGKGCLINPRNSIDDNELVSFVPMRLIADGFSSKHNSEIRPWRELKSGFTHFVENDVIVAKITPCFENRKSAIMKSLVNNVGARTTELYVIRSIKNLILSEYILCICKTEEFIKGGIQTYTGTAGQQRVKKDYITSLVIGLPPLNEQKRIVKKVDSLMALCDSLEKELQTKVKYSSLSSKSVFNSIGNCSSLEKLEETLGFIIENFKELTLGDNGVKELKNAILQLAVQGKLVSQDPDDEPASILLEKIKEEKERLIKEKKIKKEKSLSEIREEEKKCELPIGWSYVRFAELIESMNNGIYKHESFFNPLGVICLRMYNIFKGSIVLKDLVRIMLTEEELNIYKLIKGDLLLNRVNSRELVGKTAVIDEYTEDMIYESKNIRIRLMEKSILPIYLNYYLQSDGVRNIFSGDAKKTCGQASINQQQIRNLVIELPPLNEQKRIVQKVDSLMVLCDELEKRIEKSKKYSEKLMEALLIRY